MKLSTIHTTVPLPKESEVNVLDTLTERYNQVEKALKARIRNTPAPVSVPFGMDDNGMQWEELGMFLHKGSWRLCHQTCETDPERGGRFTDGLQPVAEAPAHIRLRCAPIV